MRQQGRRPTSRRPRSRPSPTSAARWPQLAIGAAEQVVEHSLDQATNTAARRGLHQPGRSVELMDAATRIGLRRGAVPDRRAPRASLGEVEDELFRFARIARGQRRAARRPSPTRTSRSAGASRSSRTCSAARPTRSPSALVSMVVGARPRPRPAGHRRRLVGSSAAPEANKEVAEVRSAVAAHRRPEGPPRRGPGHGHRQAGRAQGHHRPVGLGRPRRPGRRHRDRRLRPHAASTSSADHALETLETRKNHAWLS